MNALEIRATACLSLIQALRLLGMFMILPVFALYARDLPGGNVTPSQIGWAIGIYGLVQAALQIPFGMASDRFGRKPVIVFGLLLLAVGSWIAGATQDIHWIILGRAIQGMGAVSSAVAALLADVTRAQVRTQAMAIMGIGLGLSFILAFVLGPVFSGWIGVDGIFRMTGWLALLAIVPVLFAIPNAPRNPSGEGNLRRVLSDPQLLRLDGGIFLLHTMMTALFIAAPHAIEETLGLATSAHWKFYLPVLLISIVPVLPLIRIIEKRGKTKPAFLGAIALIGLALLIAAETHRIALGLYVAMTLFFIGLNYLEGALPSMISRRAPPAEKGAALGIYSSSQFLGGFAGATLGAYAFQHYGITGTFTIVSLLSVIWLLFAVGLNPIDVHAANQETTTV